MNDNVRDFLVELGTEELPPLALPDLERAFAAGIRQGLAEAGLPHGELRSFATPRRLAVLVRDLAVMQPAQAIKLKGPPVSAQPSTGRASPRRPPRKFAEENAEPT
jgi:glycyl-tRNA synthetase beta chain